MINIIYASRRDFFYWKEAGECQSDAIWEGLHPPLLVLKMEGGGNKPKNAGSLDAGKGED